MLMPPIERNEFMCIDGKKSQMSPIIAYLKDETLLEDEKRS